MEIYTDGSQLPSVVLTEAARILVASFSQIVNPVLVDDTSTIPASAASVMTDDLGLPTRVGNALKAAGYKTASELAMATDKDLKTVKNLGGKSLGLIDEALSAKGLTRTK